MPDYLRLIALFGIVVVNVQYIGFSVLTGPSAETLGDAITLFLVDGFATSKSYGLFSFMFGVGLGFLMHAADRSGRSLKRIYRNRMIGLAVLGFAHGILFFPGDILVIYAIVGTIFFRFRDWDVRKLVRVGGILIAVAAVLFAAVMALPDEGSLDAFLAVERAALTTGSFADAAAFRSIGFAITLPVFLVVQGTSALGWFCFGLAAVKSGMIDRADHPQWARMRRLCLVPGVGLSIAGAGLWHFGAPVLGGVLAMLVAPVATLGYLGLIAAIARPASGLMAGVLRAGGSSLSIYLGQSIVLSTLFAGYGVGLWDAVGRGTATLIAIGVTLALIAAVAAWRTRFRQGPFEVLLRRITYAGAPKA